MKTNRGEGLSAMGGSKIAGGAVTYNRIPHPQYWAVVEFDTHLHLSRVEAVHEVFLKINIVDIRTVINFLFRRDTYKR